MAIQIPNVKAPNLTRSSQNIDIPAGAFGEGVGQAISNFGATSAQAANSIRTALFREEQRRATTAANEAFKNVPIDQQNKLDAARLEAMKTPTASLPGFVDAQTKRFDDDMKAISKDMDEGTKRRFDALTLSTRTQQGISNNKWARQQMVVNGRNQMNAAVAALIATAATAEDTEDLKLQAAGVLMTGHSNGYLLDNRFNPQNIDEMIGKSNRQIDRNKAHSKVDKEPRLLLDMLDDPNQLDDLTDADETEFRNRARASERDIAQKFEMKAWAENINIFENLALSAMAGTANYNELAFMIDATRTELDALPDKDPKNPSGVELIIRQRIDVLSDLITMENSPEGEVIDAKAQKIIIDRKAQLKADQDPDVGKPPVVSEEEKFANQTAFIGRYNEYIISKTRSRGSNRKGPAATAVVRDANVQLQDLANLQGDLIRAVALGKVTRGFALTYFEKLMDPMKKMIESKHFQAQEGFWVADKKPDKYSGPFTHVLSELEKAAEGGAEFMNDPIAQNLAITFVFEEAERQDLSDDGIKNDSIKTQEAITNISKTALDRTKRWLLSLDSSERVPDGVMRFAETAPVQPFPVAPQGAIDKLLADPDNKVFIDDFIDAFGQEAFDEATK